MAHDCPAHRDRCRRPPDNCEACDPEGWSGQGFLQSRETFLRDVGLSHLRQGQRERDVLAHCHMRVKRVRLNTIAMSRSLRSSSFTRSPAMRVLLTRYLQAQQSYSASVLPQPEGPTREISAVGDGAEVAHRWVTVVVVTLLTWSNTIRPSRYPFTAPEAQPGNPSLED